MNTIETQLQDRIKLTRLLVETKITRGEALDRLRITLQVGVEAYTMKYQQAWVPYYEEKGE